MRYAPQGVKGTDNDDDDDDDDDVVDVPQCLNVQSLLRHTIITPTYFNFGYWPSSGSLIVFRRVWFMHHFVTSFTNII
jgi:hypothetical protein